MELAVLLPFLAFLAMMTVDFGRVLYTSVILDNLAHNAALYDSLVFDNQNQQYIPGTPQYWQGASGQIDFYAAILDGSNVSPAVTQGAFTRTYNGAAPNQTVKVTVQYDFQLLMSNLFGFFPNSTITLTRSCEMRVAPPQPS